MIFFLIKSWFPCPKNWKQSCWRSLSTMGCSCRWREDHTHHLSQEEYFCNKNKWWLHLNKSGSDVPPLRKRFDFKQALSISESLHRENGREQFATKKGTEEYTIIVLIHHEQSCTSELFKVIQDSISLVLHCRTVSKFRKISSSSVNVLHRTSRRSAKKQQNNVYWVDIQLMQQTSYDTLLAFYFPKAAMMEIGEIVCEKICASPRPPPKISFHTIVRKNWVQKLLEEVKTPNKPNQKPKNNCEKGETCSEWATIRFAYSGNRQRCLVWLRKHQRKHGDTCEQLCASVCWMFR